MGDDDILDDMLSERPPDAAAYTITMNTMNTMNGNLVTGPVIYTVPEGTHASWRVVQLEANNKILQREFYADDYDFAQKLKLKPWDKFDMEDPTSLKELSNKATKYIQQLCGVTGTGMQYLPPELDFTEKDITLTKQEINKIFFDFKKTQAVIKVELPSETRHALNAFFDPRNEVDRMMNQQGEIRDKVARKQRELEKLMTTNIRHEKLIEAIRKEVAMPFADVIESINADGKWAYNSIAEAANGNSKKISFITTNPVMIRWFDAAAKIDHVVNMGKFRATIDLINYCVSIDPYTDNIRISDIYYHPHVNHLGDVCWGNATNQIMDAFRKFQLAKILHITFTLLHEYNDDSPYATLDKFLAVQDQSQDYVPIGRKWFYELGAFDDIEIELSTWRTGLARLNGLGAEFQEVRVIELSTFARANSQNTYIFDDEDTYRDMTHMRCLEPVRDIQRTSNHESYDLDGEEELVF